MVRNVQIVATLREIVPLALLDTHLSTALVPTARCVQQAVSVSALLAVHPVQMERMPSPARRCAQVTCHYCFLTVLSVPPETYQRVRLSHTPCFLQTVGLTAQCVVSLLVLAPCA